MLKRLLIFSLFLPLFIKGQNYPAKPGNYVTDETRTLTKEQEGLLNAKLKAFEDTTTNQVFVYMTASLNGEDMAQFCQTIFHEWHIGQKDKNNGVLIAVFKDDHKFRIQTGYGLEGQLPDLLTKRIQDNDMRPLFKQGDYFGGINTGIDLLAYYSCHAFSPDPVKENETKSIAPLPPAEFDYGKGLSGLLIGYGINGLMLFLYIRQLRKKNRDRPTRKVIFMTIAIIFALFPCFGSILLFFMLLFIQDTKGISSSGSYSSYSGSSWSSSDSSSFSSDFGGGGGGDSGGGGSSSDW